MSFLIGKKIKYRALIILLIFSSSQTFSQVTCTSNGNGDWNQANTWDCDAGTNNGPPIDGTTTTIDILSGHTVTVTATTPDYSGMTINIFGTIYVEQSEKLELASDGTVHIYPGGLLDGFGNASAKLDIGNGAAEWDGGDGPLPGPITITDGDVSTGVPIILPIELISFEAEYENSNVLLKWKTAQELNNDYFTVEKSHDLITWETTSIQKGAGNSYKILSYTAIDETPYNGVSYYRLKQTDTDGSFDYSHIEVVNSIHDSELEIYPNPAIETFAIEFRNIENDQIIIMDHLGSIINIPSYIHHDKIVYDVSEVKKGLYIITIFHQNEKITQRLKITGNN